MASFANPYASARGPQPNTGSYRPSYQNSRPQSLKNAERTGIAAYQPGQVSVSESPGKAQSIAPQSQGTPYQAYAQPRPASQTVTGDPRGGYVTATASQRPAPFQMGAAQTPWGQSMDPFVEREAFVNQLNQQRMQNQIAFNSGGPTDPTAGMTPGLDYQRAMQQAGLGGGAPSMAADYGDSMISRLNQAFGGQGDPFTFANQQQPATPYQPSPGAQPRLPPAAPNSGNEYLRNPNAALQPYAGIYAAGTDITKLPFTDTMQPNPAYRPQNGMPSQGQSAGVPRYSPVGDTQVPIMQDGRPAYGRDTTAKSQNAEQFIRQLSQTNPATWNDQQWQDYQNAQRDTGFVDGGGYYRGPDGRVYYGGGYGMPGGPAPTPIGQDAQRNQYGTWEMPPQNVTYGSPMTASDRARNDKVQRDLLSSDYMRQKNAARANQQGYYQPQGSPPQAPAAPANPYGPPVTDRPATQAYTPPRTGIDANRTQFLQNKAAGKYEKPAATYDDYVKSGLDDAVGKVLNSPAGYQLYNEHQYGDPSQKKAYGDRLKNLIYASASQQNVAPADDWMSKKTGKSAAEGKDQYFNDAMSRYAAKQPAGKAQSIQPQSRGMPYEYEPSLPPGTTAADIWQRYKDRNAAPINAPQVRQPAFTNRPWQARS